MSKTIKFFSMAVIVAAIVFSISCKKVVNQSNNGGDSTGDNNDNKALVSIMDSLYLYAHQIYFWNNYLPTYSKFNPSQYASGSGLDSTKLLSELFALAVTYNSAINPQTGRSYEYYANDSVNPGDLAGPKYSYFEDISTYSTTAAVLNSSDYLDGTDYGFGFYPGIWNDTTLLIRSVERGSPFDLQGIQRGDRILKINSSTMNFTGSGTASINLINSVLNHANTASASFEIQRTRSGVVDTVNINSLSPQIFTFNPIYKDTVITSSKGQKVGYIAYQSFTNWSSNSSSALQSAFNAFADSSITELVIDLRYNGGGYVETSQDFANLVVPSSANGKKMYTEYYNDTLTAGKATLMANQNYPVQASEWSAANNTFNFSKLGSVGSLSRVFFLVSDNTASAAELLINNLKPYLTVKLIGTEWESGSGNNTYGKPVGFFPINISKYTFYIPEFSLGNATDPVGGATYFNGITVDNASTDDARYDFGNPKETALAQALYYIDNGSFSSALNAGYITNRNSLSTFQLKKVFINPSGFNGMIHNPGVKRR